MNIKAGDLLIETMQEVWTERSSYTGWSAGLTFVAGSPYPIPSGSYNRNLGSRDKKWAEIPAWVKGKDIYIDLEGECKLIGGGILGSNITLNAKSLDWIDVHSEDKSREKSFGLAIGSMNMGQLGSGAVTADRSFSNLATRVGSIFKGFASYSQSGSDQERDTRATISKDANMNLKDQGQGKDVSGLNRDENKMVETSKKDEYTYSIGVPIVDIKELKEKLENSWALHQQEVQQKIEDKNLPEQEREILETEQEVTKVVKEEAVKEGLEPDDVKDVIDELTEEEYAARNLKKLSEYHDNKEIPVEEAIEVLQGKQPIKNDKGEIEFTNTPKSFDKYKVVPEENIGKQPSSEESLWSKLKTNFNRERSWEEDQNFNDMLDAMSFGVGGTALKIGIVGKTTLKSSGKVISKGIKPAIEGLKKFIGSKAKVELMKDTVKIEEHNFLTNKHTKFFTENFEEIVSKYDLKLNQKWNKELMEHGGRHATEYHKWALEQAKKISELAKGSQEKFLKLFEEHIATKVRAKPEMLRKEYWIKLNQGELK